MKTKLPSGITGFHENGRFVCTGSQMGRGDSLPPSKGATPKVSLRRLRWVDHDYDQWGAYWGGGMGDFIWWGQYEDADECKDIFVRAFSRDEAKDKVREEIPLAKFYR